MCDPVNNGETVEKFGAVMVVISRVERFRNIIEEE